ncbi:MAG: ATP-dependent zinc metalloprotease FtsH, partial [Oscillospiraceae bacterium]
MLLPNKKKTISIYAIVLVVLLLGVYFMTTMIKPQTKQYTHSEIVYMFEDNLVEKYSLNIGTGELELKINMNNPKAKDVEETNLDKDKNKYVKAIVPYITKFQEDIKASVDKYNIEHSDNKMEYNFIAPKDNSMFFQIALTFIPLILLGVLFFFMMRQSGGGGKMNQFSKANTKTIQAGKKTTFAEVAGADEEKEELYEIVEFLKKPSKYSELGARIPKGVLLVGPPGTGKTLLARAVAGEAGVPFYSISGSDFVEMFVGVGASRVRDLFTTAKKNAPSIVFIDEIDAVGRHRGAGLGGGHDEREQTLNQLLVEMDGFGENEGVIIIAATNRRDILDPALLRPGRFDRQVIVGYPDVKGREEILKVHSRNKPLGFDVDLNKIARTTAGFTGADLENLLNEAALLAARNHRKAIIEDDIEAATIKVVAGPEKKSHKISDKDKKITAFHEAGHAVVTYFCPTQDSVHEVSIIPRGMAAGYTMHLPTEDTMHVSKRKMSEDLVVLLAGRVAEEVALDDICTGASNDIERATATARGMVTHYGFSSTLGPIVYGQPDGEVFLGRELNHQ